MSTLDFSKVPSFVKLYEEKCRGANGDVYTTSLECDNFAFKDFPRCVENCPNLNGFTDYIDKLADMESWNTLGCEWTVAKKDTSAKSAASVVGGLKVVAGAAGAFLTMFVL